MSYLSVCVHSIVALPCSLMLVGCLTMLHVGLGHNCKGLDWGTVHALLQVAK